jgi:predicted DNA-binding protein with PD1-like motif
MESNKIIIKTPEEIEIMKKSGQILAEVLFAILEAVKPGVSELEIDALAEKMTLSYYNLSEKKYEDTIIEEDLEITSVIGNIAWLDETAIIHAHGTFGNKNLEVIGGHIKSLIISATGEVFLQQVQTKLIREYNEETGLNLLK